MIALTDIATTKVKELMEAGEVPTTAGQPRGRQRITN